jgi:hypothetical protein
MSRTRAQLISRVLSNLGLGNDTPAAEDVAKVDPVVDDVVKSLSLRSVYTVPDPGSLGPTGGNIDPAIFQDLALLVTAAAAPQFDDADPKWQGLVLQSEDNIRVMAAPSRTRRTLRVDAALIGHWPRGYYRGGY